MKAWWILLVLAACRHDFVTVAGDGGDGDGNAGVPTSVYLDQATTFGANLDEARVVPYDREVRDANDDFDPATHTFTAPRADDYLFCASLASTDVARFDLQIKTATPTSTRERRLDFGSQVVSGCTVLRLAAAQTAQLVVITSQASQTFQHDPLATWLTIDVLSNTAISAGATGLERNFVTPADVAQDVPLKTVEHGTLDSGGFSSPGTGDYLVCGALETVLGRVELSIYVKPGSEYVVGVSVASRGSSAVVSACGVVRLPANALAGLRATSENTTGYSDLGSEIWLSVDRLANDAWAVFASATLAISVADSTPTIVPFIEVRDDGNLFGPDSRFRAPGGGPALVCASYLVPVEARLVVFLDNTAHATLAQGIGRLGGCTVLALDAEERVDVRVVHQAGSNRTFANDADARLTIDKLR